MELNRLACFVVLLALLAVGCDKKPSETTKTVKKAKGTWWELSEAVKSGDIERVQSLVSGGVDVNKRSKVDPSALHHAAINGFTNIAELLINNGAEIDIRDMHGRTPLFLALWNGHESLARLLVDRGADVNAMDRLGYTPLLCAFRCKSEVIAAVLIEKGAAVDVYSRELPWVVEPGRPPGMPHPFVYKNRPIHYAATFGYKKVVELLLAKGADVNAKNENGKTALDIASDAGREDIVELLR